MKKLLTYLITFCAIQSAFGQKTQVITTLKFSGKIDKYPVEVSLDVNSLNDSVSGTYYYQKIGKSNHIYLEGTLVNNKLKLSEKSYHPNNKTDKFPVTGSFDANWSNGSKITGTWQNKAKDKSLTVDLNPLQNLSKFNPANYTFKLNIYKGKTEGVNGGLVDYTKTNSLKIYNKDKLVQTLTGFDEVIYNKNGSLELEDLNFDGILDLKIPIYFPSRLKNDNGYLYYIYNAQTGKYGGYKMLNELEIVDFDAKQKEIIKYEADGSGNETTSYYKWFNNNLYLIREEKSYENDALTHYTEYKIENKKSVKVKEYKK